MTLFYFILHLMCLYNKKYNFSNNFNEKLNQHSINIENEVDSKGMDERPFVDNTNLDLISINIHKKRILDSLLSPNVSSFHKSKIINEYDILKNEDNNILNGGLLDDFNFDIEL